MSPARGRPSQRAGRRRSREPSGARRVQPLLSSIGEMALLGRLGSLLPREPRWVRVGRGADDAAVLDLGGDTLALLTCDVQLEGRHFRRDWLDAYQIGRRAASVNLSDIAAMGGEPQAALVSLMLPGSFPVRDFNALMRGVGDRLFEYGAAVVGGNLAQSARDIGDKLGMKIDAVYQAKARVLRRLREELAELDDAAACGVK